MHSIWMNIRNIVLSERSQMQKKMYVPGDSIFMKFSTRQNYRDKMQTRSFLELGVVGRLTAKGCEGTFFG